MTYSAEPRLLTQMGGHAVYPSDEGWRYLNNDALVKDEGQRACTKCQRKPVNVPGTGMVDQCFVTWREFTDRGGQEQRRPESTLPDDVSWACCGHGVEDGYIRWGNVFEMSTDAVLVKEE